MTDRPIASTQWRDTPGGHAMSPHPASGTRPSRRTLLRAGAAATAAGALGAWTRSSAPAVALADSAFGSPDYDAALAATGGVKGIFQSPHVDANFVAGDFVNHLLLLQLKNWLNSFELSYKTDASDLHTLVATYASANVLTYDDTIWEKYKLGEKYQVTDPTTNAPAIRNPFRPSRFGPDAPKDPAAPNNYYQDTGIEALQKRGTLFLTCNNSLNGHAASAVADKRAPDGMEAADVAADLQAHLVPGATLVPAVVGEVSRAMAAGYSLIFIPKFLL
jgi:intracellular sulfur oxidation DsrE/DsrF family protein